MSFVKPFSSSILVAAISILIYNYINNSPDKLVVYTRFGQIEGFKGISRDGRSYSSFHGIPYAKPPLGQRRFKPPEEFGSWNGTFDATGSIPACLHADLIFKNYEGQEDCLILNVFTPNIPQQNITILSGRTDLLPVMVWFHGGHWMCSGSHIYGPQYFMDENVVLVTVNYRLGAFGFLNTGDDVVSGNMAMKDQVLALKWIQKAIQDFGGDPNLVTLFGESAGGAIADLHTLSPMSKGLFHRAISQSGSATCPWVLTSNTKVAAENLGRAMHCPIDNSKKLVACLRKLDAQEIVQYHSEIFEPFFPPEAIFGPSIENVSNPAAAFLTESPSKLLREQRILNRVPHLFGVTSHEGCYRTSDIATNPEKYNELQRNWKTQFPNLFIYDKNHVGAAEPILNHYFGVSSISADTPNMFTMENYSNFTQAVSERLFWKCLSDSALTHSVISPTYMYMISYEHNSFGFGHLIEAGSAGADILIQYLKKLVADGLGLQTNNYGFCHLDDITYLFDTLPFFRISTSSPHYEFSRSLVKLWVKFAKDGNPGSFQGVQWDKINPKDSVVSYMNLDTKSEMIQETLASGSKFWDSLNI